MSLLAVASVAAASFTSGSSGSGFRQCSTQELLARSSGSGFRSTQELPCGCKAAVDLRGPQLLALRGGEEMRSANKSAHNTANTTANATQTSRQSQRPSRRMLPHPPFGVRDALTAALGLSAAVAVQWCCNTNFMAHVMNAYVSAHVRKPVWVCASGTLAAILFMVVRITNPSRALEINRVLSKLVLNRETQSSLPSLALIFILGVIAAIRALPAYDLRLLWAMFSSLGLVVGAAAIKFGGKRPNLMELLDWAFDSVSASLSTSSSTTKPRGAGFVKR
jgi:hypothetical protein